MGTRRQPQLQIVLTNVTVSPRNYEHHLWYSI